MLAEWTSAALATALSGLSLAAHADSSITVFDWSGYEDPAFHEAFVDKHGFSPNFAFFADEEEAFQKLRAGFKADLAHPCSQSVPRWREAGLLEPIDPAKIPNWDKLNPELRDLPGFVYEGKPYWVPFEWGNSGLTYRTDRGAGRGRAVAPGVRRPQICREDLDRRQCRRRLRAGLARDRAQGLDHR